MHALAAPLGIAARVVRVIGWAIAAALGIGILLVVVDANEDNGIVDFVLDIGRFFADPFRQIIELDDNDLQIAINWGIAALVYVVLAMVIAAVLDAIARRVARDRSVSRSSA